jgi:hypothetical protein
LIDLSGISHGLNTVGELYDLADSMLSDGDYKGHDREMGYAANVVDQVIADQSAFFTVSPI